MVMRTQTVTKHQFSNPRRGSINGGGPRAASQSIEDRYETSDEALIKSLAAGDKKAIQLLFARYNVRVFRFVLRFVRHESLAEDLVSEVFFEAWRQAGKFEGRSRGAT